MKDNILRTAYSMVFFTAFSLTLTLLDRVIPVSFLVLPFLLLFFIATYNAYGSMDFQPVFAGSVTYFAILFWLAGLNIFVSVTAGIGFFCLATFVAFHKPLDESEGFWGMIGRMFVSPYYTFEIFKQWRESRLAHWLMQLFLLKQVPAKTMARLRKKGLWDGGITAKGHDFLDRMGYSVEVEIQLDQDKVLDIKTFRMISRIKGLYKRLDSFQFSGRGFPLTLKIESSDYEVDRALLMQFLPQLYNVLVEREACDMTNIDYLEFMSNLVYCEIPDLPASFMSREECIIHVIELNLKRLGAGDCPDMFNGKSFNTIVVNIFTLQERG